MLVINDVVFDQIQDLSRWIRILDVMFGYFGTIKWSNRLIFLHLQIKMKQRNKLYSL